MNGFLKLLSANDITFSLANISFFIYPFIHYAFMEVDICALVTTGIQRTIHGVYEVSSQLHPVPEMELELSGLETIHTAPSHWPTNLFLTHFCLYFEFGDYKYSGE